MTETKETMVSDETMAAAANAVPCGTIDLMLQAIGIDAVMREIRLSSAEWAVTAVEAIVRDWERRQAEDAGACFEPVVASVDLTDLTDRTDRTDRTCDRCGVAVSGWHLGGLCVECYCKANPAAVQTDADRFRCGGCGQALADEWTAWHGKLWCYECISNHPDFASGNSDSDETVIETVEAPARPHLDVTVVCGTCGVEKPVGEMSHRSGVTTTLCMDCKRANGARARAARGSKAKATTTTTKGATSGRTTWQQRLRTMVIECCEKQRGVDEMALHVCADANGVPYADVKQLALDTIDEYRAAHKGQRRRVA